MQAVDRVLQSRIRQQAPKVQSRLRPRMKVEKGSQEEKELTGTIDDIKDFMFVVTDDKDTPYSFTFDEKPDGLENVVSGDKVTVKYTGTISEVDPFEGKIISVEKAE